MYGKNECFVMQKFYDCVLCASCGSPQFCMYGCMYFLAELVLVCVDVMAMSSA